MNKTLKYNYIRIGRGQDDDSSSFFLIFNILQQQHTTTKEYERGIKEFGILPVLYCTSIFNEKKKKKKEGRT